MKTVDVVPARAAYLMGIEVDRGDPLVLWPERHFKSVNRRVDSPFASWPRDEEPTGYIDADRLGVYHPPFQELASQRTTSAGRSTMGTTDSTTQDEQTKTDGQNTGAQTDGSSEQSNTSSQTEARPTDPAYEESDRGDEGEGLTGTAGGVPETDGATAG